MPYSIIIKFKNSLGFCCSCDSVNSFSNQQFLSKLCVYRFSNRVVKTFGSFLVDRSQCVKLKDVVSEWKRITTVFLIELFSGLSLSCTTQLKLRKKCKEFFKFYRTNKNTSKLTKRALGVLEETATYIKQIKQCVFEC